LSRTLALRDSESEKRSTPKAGGHTTEHGVHGHPLLRTVPIG